MSRHVVLALMCGLLVAACGRANDETDPQTENQGELKPAVNEFEDQGEEEARYLTVPDYTLSNFTYSGTGCPANSTRITMMPNNSGFTSAFESGKFYAAYGEGIPKANNTRNCTLSFKINYTKKWKSTQFVLSSNSTGYAQIASARVASTVAATIQGKLAVSNGAGFAGDAAGRTRTVAPQIAFTVVNPKPTSCKSGTLAASIVLANLASSTRSTPTPDEAANIYAINTILNPIANATTTCR